MWFIVYIRIELEDHYKKRIPINLCCFCSLKTQTIVEWVSMNHSWMIMTETRILGEVLFECHPALVF